MNQMEKHEILVYMTHIEVTNYRFGDWPEVELMMSKKDKSRHCLLPIGYYIDEGYNKLYLPRGFDIAILERHAKTQAILMKCRQPVSKLENVAMTVDPRNGMQEDAIAFLTATGLYENPQGCPPQLGLNMPTGTGKTYCSINSMVTKKLRSIIICHSKKILNQWMTGIDKFTDIDMDRVLFITGSRMIEALMDGRLDPVAYDFFITTHQTLASFASIDGWVTLTKFFEKLRVSLKILDETHLYFENALKLDFFSDVPLTWYLTATYGRSDIQQNIIYKKAYSTVYRFGNKIERYRHTISFIVFIDSHPENKDKRFVQYSNSYGYSAVNFMTYEFLQDKDVMLNTVHRILKQCKDVEGIRLVLSGLQKTTELIADEVRSWYPKWDTIVVHSKHNASHEEMEESDCISCTYKMMGTGADIKGVRVLIVTEPIGSAINMEQVMGRLHPYIDEEGKERETLFYYIVDTGFRKCVQMYERIDPVIRKLSKQVYTYDLR